MGTPESIKAVKSIVSTQERPCIVVVSALGGITDQLIRTASLAAAGDVSFREILTQIRNRHYDVIDNVGVTEQVAEALKEEISVILDRLESICEGVFLLKVLPSRIQDEIVSFGERMSSRIVSAAIPGSKVCDSLEFIKTKVHEGRVVADKPKTFELIRKALDSNNLGEAIAIVPGFISTDSRSGDISNLGRGGSDYTASLIAAALDAEMLEIWTDVDGFMTADPRIIKTSCLIDQMSYQEAMELCTFGAKVVYSPTLYPVCQKGIPILIKNTFNPSAPGTLICEKAQEGPQLIKGISSIDDISLITLSGTSMVGVVGVDGRIFSRLAKENISAFLVTQSASETSITIGVSRRDAELAAEALNDEFQHEIASGINFPIFVKSNLAAITVVGENMKGHEGVAGKLFSLLGRNGISVVSLAQGAFESNISFVVDRAHLRKALTIIHDGFFLSEHREINLVVCGVGTVGSKLMEQIAAQREYLLKSKNLKLNVVGIARSTRALFNPSGIDSDNYREQLDGAAPTSLESLKEQILNMNLFNTVFVDCTASEDVAAIYGELFKKGISVVAANKVAASSEYGNYNHLKAIAQKHGVSFRYETNVGAALPLIGTINDMRDSGDRILKIEAVLSGSINFILNTMSAQIPFSKAVRMAQEQGYTEPDPRIDLSGKDVMRKIVILSREAGYTSSMNDVRTQLFLPENFFTCSIEEFWALLPSLDEQFERQRQALEKENKRWRFIATMDEGRLDLSLQSISPDHPFHSLEGSNNIAMITSARYSPYPLIIRGYGAGADVTASGIFSDILKTV